MEKDVFGEALVDYYQGKRGKTLWLHNNYGEKEEMPIGIFFRTPQDFPELEFIALSLCDGTVLDVGAGAGSHCLYLQERGFNVTALELSQKACTLMKARGVQQIVRADIFAFKGKQFDTLLFLMNGIGIAQTLAGLKQLLEHCKLLLKKGGQLLFDSSDIRYLYEEGLNMPDYYFGEIHFQYEYDGNKGAPFSWLYIDQETLISLGHQLGWIVQILYEEDDDQYLVRMSLPH